MEEYFKQNSMKPRQNRLISIIGPPSKAVHLGPYLNNHSQE